MDRGLGLAREVVRPHPTAAHLKLPGAKGAAMAENRKPKAAAPAEDREFQRDPEARPVDEHDPRQVREKMLDKTDADSFPASDPPSTIPDPEEDSFAA